MSATVNADVDIDLSARRLFGIMDVGSFVLGHAILFLMVQ